MKENYVRMIIHMLMARAESASARIFLRDTMRLLEEKSAAGSRHGPAKRLVKRRRTATPV